MEQVRPSEAANVPARHWVQGPEALTATETTKPGRHTLQAARVMLPAAAVPMLAGHAVQFEDPAAVE